MINYNDNGPHQVDLHTVAAVKLTPCFVTYCSMLGERYSLGKTWVASASSKLTERRATSSPGSSVVSWEKQWQVLAITNNHYIKIHSSEDYRAFLFGHNKCGKEMRKDTRRNICSVSCNISFNSCNKKWSWWLRAPIKSCVRRMQRPPGAACGKLHLSLQGPNFSFCDVFPRAWLLPRDCH